MAKSPDGTRTRLGIIPELNGLRGLGSSIVVLGHVFVSWHFVLAPVLMDLFFIYSAMFVTRIFLNIEFNWKNVRTFYFRRALRIWPLYYAVTISCLVFEQVLPMLGFRGRPHDFWEWLRILSFLQYVPSYFEVYGANTERLLGHTWSIAIEEQFYITWPIVLIVLIRSRLAGCILLLILSVAAQYAGNHGIASHLYLCRLDSFALGTLSAVAVHDRLFRIGRFSGDWRNVLIGVCSGSSVICVLLAAGVLFAVPKPMPDNLIVGFDDNSGISFVFKVFFASMVGTIMLTSGAAIWKFLTAAPLQFLGALAYQLYLIHLPVLLIVARLAGGMFDWSRPESAWVGIPLIIGLSYWWYRKVEIPAEQRRQKTRYQQKSQQTA